MLQDIQVQMVKINEKISIKIYDHISCICIIQNLIFLHNFARERSPPQKKNRYNGSWTVVTFSYTSHSKYSKFYEGRDSVKVNRAYHYEALTNHEMYND
jgi:hypothetical protein